MEVLALNYRTFLEETNESESIEQAVDAHILVTLMINVVAVRYGKRYGKAG